MKKVLLRGDAVLDPLLAAVFLAGCIAVAGGSHPLTVGMRAAHLQWWAVIAAIAVAIALCRRVPVAAMSLTVAALVVQFVDSYSVFFDGEVLIYLALLYVVAGVALGVSAPMRALGWVFAIFVGAAAGILVAVRAPWLSSGPLSPTDVLVKESAALLLCSLAAASAYAIGYLSRNRYRRFAGPRSGHMSTESMGWSDVSAATKSIAVRWNRWIDPIVAALLLAFWAFWLATDNGATYGNRVTNWITIVGLAAAIALARRAPVPTIAITLVAMFAADFTLLPTSVLFVFFLVIAAVAFAIPNRLRWLSLGFAIAIAAGLGIGEGAFAYADFTRVVGFPLFAIASWALGRLANSWRRAKRSEKELARTTADLRETETDLIVARERDRIAQDVHDIMAHSLSVIIAQADGARFLASERPQAVSGSLAHIADVARNSLTEVRMLIETLVSEPQGHSSPTLVDLNELVDRMIGAGLTIALEHFGEPTSLTTTQELAVYRIVQEGLTNALKHAGRNAQARVSLDWRGTGLSITVSSRGDTPQSAEAGGNPVTLGRGLYGMRERARLAGGWLDAGPDDDSGYLVTAFVPTSLAVAS